MPDNNEGWNLVFQFPDQSPQFAHGFACGRLWEQMRTPGAVAISTTVDSAVRETVEAMAMQLGWVEDITDIGDGWIQVDLTKPEGWRDVEAPPIVPQSAGRT